MGNQKCCVCANCEQPACKTALRARTPHGNLDEGPALATLDAAGGF